MASGEWQAAHSRPSKSARKHMKSYQELDIWRRGMKIAEQAYRLTRAFPKQEMFGLVSQIRRAASSISANIAEGWGRQADKEFSQFLRFANGSLRELETHLLLSTRVDLTNQTLIQPILDELEILSKQLVTFQRKLNR